MGGPGQAQLGTLLKLQLPLQTSQFPFKQTDINLGTAVF